MEERKYNFFVWREDSALHKLCIGFFFLLSPAFFPGARGDSGGRPSWALGVLHFSKIQLIGPFLRYRGIIDLLASAFCDELI